jgi:uncharacterized metal-binding protein
MPSGRTHDSITWFLAMPVFYATWRLTGRWGDATLAAVAFVFAGLMFSGDLDLRSAQYYRWGLLRWIWKPYQWLVPHRSPLSHGLILGPAVRLLYLSAVVLAIGWGVLTVLHDHGWTPVPSRVVQLGMGGLAGVRLSPLGWEYLASFMAGLWAGGASHTLADRFGTGWKRLWRGRRRRH